jgi:hypothetical protein
MTRELGRRIVTDLTGEEMFAFEYGGEKHISAKDLRSYLRGDIAVPAFRLEAGANSRKISDLPNAETAMGSGDRITGLQDGANVNFSMAHIVAPLVESIRDLAVRCENIERLLKQVIPNREPGE